MDNSNFKEMIRIKMRQTDIKNYFSLFGRVLVALLCLVLLPLPVLAQGTTSFQDLPKDHWAYSDIDFLISQGYMEGYPDGTFKGRKVTTRYDVALIIARILKRMEEKKATIDAASEEERAALTRLTKEFRDELGLLDVRVDSLERRMVDNENKIKSLEKMLPKVKVYGFYRGRGQYILEPKTVNRDECGDEYNFTEPGLVTFYQDLYLRFMGKPLGDKVETFYELLGHIHGKTFNRLVYNNAGNSTPNPFDNIDDYVRQVRNDTFVKSNKLHLISRAKSMKFRVWAGEYATGLDDPMNLLTEDTDIVKPYQGVEVSGSTDSGFSYQGSVLNSDTNNGSLDDTDIITGRMVWELPESFSKTDKFTIGTTYAEKIPEYKTRGNSNAVSAFDIGFSSERAGKIQGTAEFLTSKSYLEDKADNNTKKSMEDSGSRIDLSFQEGGFTGTFKHYSYGKYFRAMMAPVWAYDCGGTSNYPYNLDIDDDNITGADQTRKGNYGRGDFEGERLNRFSLNYDFGNKLLSISKNLSIEATYLTKNWEEDPNDPRDTDGFSGKKFTFQLISDFNDNTTLKYDFVRHMDALENEEGSKSNAVELNLKLNDTVNAKGKIYIKNDPDATFTEGADTYDYNERVGYFEVNSDINPRVFVKGSIEHSVCWTGTPKESTRIDYIGEATYNLTPTTSFTGGIQHVDYEDSYEAGKSSLANAIIAELKKNFTNKFRGRAFYSRAIIDYKDSKSDSLDRENIYGELIYNVSKDATISFKFGYDYPYEWKWAVSSVDNGRDYIDIHTQKMFIFEAKSNF